MKKHKRNAESGFTLLEVFVVLVFLLVVGALLVPEFTNSLERAKLRGIAQETTVLMRLARLDAIKHSRSALVVMDLAGPDVASPENNVDRMIACPDVNNNLRCDPIPAERRLGEFVLPKGVFFRDELGNRNGASVKDFTVADPSLPNVAVFDRDGSIRVDGAFRFADHCATGGNVLEVRVAPRATARVEVRKWRPSPSRYDASGEGPSRNDTGSEAWQWYRACSN